MQFLRKKRVIVYQMLVKNMRFGKVSPITYSGSAASYRRSAPSYSLKEASHRAPPVL